MAPIDRGSSVHGGDGLGDIGLPEPAGPPASGHAVDAIIALLRQSPGEITLCPIGPLTNIALAFIKAPDIIPMVREIVFMGGAAFVPGNTTPAAEFNVGIDPEAAQIVLTAGAPLTMFGLDVTAKALITEAWLASLEQGAGPCARAAAAMMRSYGRGDLCLHDPCVIAHLLDPTLFSGIEARVEVDCVSGLNRGRTVAAVSNRHRRDLAATCQVMTDLAPQPLFTLLAERLHRLDRERTDHA